MKNSTLLAGLVWCCTSFVAAQDPIRARDLTTPCKGPLIIVDGVMLPCAVAGKAEQGSAMDLDQQLRLSGVKPEDIASVGVLKGAAAASVYGADAVNGVIQIVTKGGRTVSAKGVEDPLARFLFPPELVMANQQAINLTDLQRTVIQVALKVAQAKFIDLQFKASAEVEKLKRLVQAVTVDEAKTLEQVERLLAAEREIKIAQMTLMVRIKNQLTEQQQQQLDKLR